MVHVADLQADAEYTPSSVRMGSVSRVCVPMLRGDEVIGVVILYKLEVAPFTDQQIELVTTFADKAVIAIENARSSRRVRTLVTQLARSRLFRESGRMRADIHDGPEQTLQSEAGYSNARPHQPGRRKPLAPHGRTIQLGQRTNPLARERATRGGERAARVALTN